MPSVEFWAEETLAGWKAKIKTVGPSGEVMDFEKDGFPTLEAAMEEARELTYGWMASCGLGGTLVEGKI